jgi:hypothetical protein
MEFLQFVQYLVLDDCANPTNILWTAFGFVHIAFQPVFSNVALSALAPNNLQKQRDSTWAFIRNLCIVCGSLMAARVVLPAFVTLTENTGGIFDLCTEATEGVCGPRTCSTSGVFHLKWTFRTLKPGYALPNGAFHLIGMFITPLLMGQYLAPVVLFCSGPGLALLFPGIKEGERSAIWCFFSIAESLVTVFAQLVAIKLATTRAEAAEKKVEVQDQKKAPELVSKKSQ